jgi:hypothetical protein
MTLVLSDQCDDYSILLADRRISQGEKVVDDDYTKCGLVYCVDGTFAFGLLALPLLSQLSS